VSRIDEALRRARGEAASLESSTRQPYDDSEADVDFWELPEEKPQPVTTFIEAAPPVEPEPVITVLANPASVVRSSTSAAPAETPLMARLAVEPPASSSARSASAVAEVEAPAPVAVASLAVAPAVAPKRTVDAATLVTSTNRKDAVEQYRRLAATLHHVQANRGIRIVLCTSAVMSEGKTVTAANLALTLSQSYQRRVLLIDADLRRPRLHSLFNVGSVDGLYEALGSESDRKVNVVSVSPWLSLVTAGRPGPDPVHVLTSERLSRVLEDAGSTFDWVIIDTPPVLVLPDAGLLMGLVDGALFVIGAGMTTHRMATRAIDALGRDRVIGVVMNRAADSIIQESYGGYYAYEASPAD
jgi:capsular exopolysaccharide synthesis family protein